MNFDFALILVVLTLLTGLVWLLDAVLLRRRRRARAAVSGGAALNTDPWPVDWSRSLFPVLLIVLIFRSFLFEPFKIPSGSMVPTLLVGDFIVVNKFTYGLRLPVLNTKFIEMNNPQRGDVVVFRFPQDGKINYIKRVIGLPGDTVVYRNKQLFINGEEVGLTDNGRYTRQSSKCSQAREGDQRLEENLGNISHSIVQRKGINQRSTQTWRIPDGHYFVMGDNRDNSNDSRFWGYVPERNLVGKAVLIWLNFDYHQGCSDWSRVGDQIG